MRLRFILSTLLCLLAISAKADENNSAAPRAPRPGAIVANVKLKDIHRRSRSLEDFKDSKALVVAFIGTECPLANLALPKLIELNRQYAERGLQVIAINSNAQDSFLDVSAHAQERDVL